jgi:hypothetical protein
MCVLSHGKDTKAAIAQWHMQVGGLHTRQPMLVATISDIGHGTLQAPEGGSGAGRPSYFLAWWKMQLPPWDVWRSPHSITER